MKNIQPDWQHLVLIALFPGLIAALSALQGQFSAGTIGAMAVGTLLAILQALKPSIDARVNEKAALKSALKRADADDTMPPPPKPPSVPRIVTALASFALLAAFALPGCSLFKSSTGSTVINDIGGAAACVIQHLESDVNPSVESIAAECAPVVAADVVAILTALDAAPVDAGSAPAVARAHAVLAAHRGAK